MKKILVTLALLFVFTACTVPAVPESTDTSSTTTDDEKTEEKTTTPPKLEDVFNNFEQEDNNYTLTQNTGDYSSLTTTSSTIYNKDSELANINFTNGNIVTEGYIDFKKPVVVTTNNMSSETSTTSDIELFEDHYILNDDIFDYILNRNQDKVLVNKIDDVTFEYSTELTNDFAQQLLSSNTNTYFISINDINTIGTNMLKFTVKNDKLVGVDIVLDNINTVSPNGESLNSYYKLVFVTE